MKIAKLLLKGVTVAAAAGTIGAIAVGIIIGWNEYEGEYYRSHH